MKDLIFCVCDEGFADEVMKVARDNGASGGTIIHGRGSQHKAVKFFGVNIQATKEIVLCVVDVEKRNNIMQKIRDKLGKEQSKARALCFSVPVDGTAGIKGINIEETQKDQENKKEDK